MGTLTSHQGKRERGGVKEQAAPVSKVEGMRQKEVERKEIVSQNGRPDSIFDGGPGQAPGRKG